MGNPANTNALVCSHYAPSIPKENFSAMTRLDQNRAYAQLALKAGVPISEVKNAIIWGNHSSTQFPDAAHATIGGKPAKEVGWLENASFEKLNLKCHIVSHIKVKLFLENFYFTFLNPSFRIHFCIKILLGLHF